MRKLKFKAKTTNSNEWVYGYYAQGGNDNEIKGVIMPQGKSVSEIHEVRHETVCQLLCVKNGIEFYTGDILKGKQTFEKSPIYPLVYISWNDETLSYELVKINGTVNPPLNWLSEYDKVGNLIDNPELLGGR